MTEWSRKGEQWPEWNEERICEYCGKPYITVRKNQKYCSQSCKLAAKGSRAEYVKALYKSRVDEHKCVLCGQQDETTLSGKVMCSACAERRNAAARARRERMKHEGRCTVCGKPAASGTLCDECRGKRVAYFINRDQRKVCRNCGKQDERTLSGKKLCEACEKASLAHSSEYYSLAQLRGKCVICHKPLPEGWYYVRCPECQERAKAKGSR